LENIEAGLYFNLKGKTQFLDRKRIKGSRPELFLIGKILLNSQNFPLEIVKDVSKAEQ
jgi:hypothetical protein